MIATFGVSLLPFIDCKMSILIPAGVRMSFGLQLADAIHHVNHAGDQSEKSRDDADEKQRKKTQLEHHPPDSAHLANGRNFTGPIRFDEYLAVQQMQNNRAYEDDSVPRDHENRKPSREPSVFRINLAPVADAQCDNAAQEQTFVGDWIENHA